MGPTPPAECVAVAAAVTATTVGFLRPRVRTVARARLPGSAHAEDAEVADVIAGGFDPPTT